MGSQDRKIFKKPVSFSRSHLILIVFIFQKSLNLVRLRIFREDKNQIGEKKTYVHLRYFEFNYDFL